MKRLELSCYIAVLMLMLGCSSTGKTTRTSDNDLPRNAVSVDNTALSLADYLRQIPGVKIFGTGNNVKVMIRGPKSFIGSSEPLFVVDKRPIGTSYAQVTSLVNVNDIDYVRVLKGANAAYYGVRGGNGVILIVTEKQ